MDRLLYSIYYSYNHPAGLSTLDKLYNEAKLREPLLSKQYVSEWLSRQPSYTFHKQSINKFKRNRVLVSFMNEEFQADLMDVSKVSRVNGGVKYLLTVVDVLSKYAYAVPIKQKSGPYVAQALAKIFQDRVPFKLHSDRGLEFQNAHVKRLLKEYEVVQTTTKDKLIKASVVERFNRTLRMKLAKLKAHTKNNKYLDYLPQLMESYNNTVHRSIKMKPINVNIDNQEIAFNNLYGGKTYLEMLREAQAKPSKFNVGDFVRLKIEKKVFERGYAKSWTDQVYRISRVVSTGQVHTYLVRNSMNNELPRRYYLQDLQKIAKPTNFIDRVINKRTRTHNNKQYVELLVQWRNSTESTWVPESDVFNINE